VETVDQLPVRQVTGEGFTAQESGRLARALGIQTGKPLDRAKLAAGVRALREGGKVQALFVEASRVGNGVAIVLRGAGYRVLRRLVFEGISPELQADARKRLGLTDGERIDTQTVERLRRFLRTEYERLGYPAAAVTVDEKEASGENGGVEITVGVAAGEGTRVGKVAFLGISAEEVARLKAFVSLGPGGRFTQAELERGLDRVRSYLASNSYATARIEETALNYSPDRKTVDVAITVRLGRRYQFMFRGNVALSDLVLRGFLTHENLSQPDASTRIAALIEEQYAAIGFRFCRVEAKATISPDGRSELVEFVVAEGPRVRISEVSFSGADAAMESRLREWFYEGAPGVLARGVFWEGGLKEATGFVELRARARGYLSAALPSPKLVFSGDKSSVELLYDIGLGTQTVLGAIEVRDGGGLTPERAAEILGVNVGEPIDAQRLEGERGLILDYYRSQGYADAAFAAGEWIEIPRDKRSAILRIEVNRGRRFVVGGLTLEGNTRTKSEVILREMQLHENEPFDPAKLRRSEEGIALLGLFSRVEIVTQDRAGSNPPVRDLKIVVRETAPGLGEVGFGGSYEDPRLRLRTFLGLAYRNLGGRNQTVSARSELALPISRDRFVPFVEYATIFGYRAPYPFDWPVTFSSQVGLDSFAVQEALSNNPTIQTRAKIEGKVERKISGTLTGIYRLYRYERTKTEKLVTGGPTVDSIGSTGPGLILDLRDDIFNPTRGSFHTLDLELASPILLSQEDIAFLMVMQRNSFYFPLVSPFSVTVSAGMGYAKSLFRGKPLPRARLVNDLALGGQNSIRGYSVRIFSPDKSDPKPEETAFYNVRVELGVKLFSSLSAAGFVDTGEIFPHLRGTRRHDGVGVGLRYKTPVGPLVVDIAHGLGRDQEGVRFYFTVGTL